MTSMVPNAQIRNWLITDFVNFRIGTAFGISSLDFEARLYLTFLEIKRPVIICPLQLQNLLAAEISFKKDMKSPLRVD